MKYKISLSTYSPDIVAVLSALGYKKSQYIEQALIHFTGTKRGKNTLRLILNGHGKPDRSQECGGKPSRSKKTSQKVSSEKLDVDSFLG